jgi:hypothetical protein
VLSGAMHPLRPRTEVLYCDAPLGVAYLVAYLHPTGAASTSSRSVSTTP